ncbi:hypothetical protein F0P96_03030 [Hymenobacter busanensis]|uniref:Uncharacterized protein n=1 Tax=Hymenobacter busanensis TaxID=2607656 RepID=A0A7L4ZTF6_9BACT|nr:hypothetical protein [Hymenobacter busanensis]KAA9339601.1 hypothetical protein F0P96_03030 [Hymenobacter busanensis]QHJ06644.1 hypothetical protein GUY19_04725 [Hymenobacter busanensis]
MDKLDLRKLYVPAALNSWQTIAVTGLIMSAAAHVILVLLGHSRPAGFNWLYVCWTALYVVGSLTNLFGKPDEDHHH